MYREITAEQKTHNR